MKNVKPDQLKKCITLTTEEFTSIIKNLFGSNTQVEYSLDGIWIGDNNGANIDYDTEICAKLADYFDVSKVTSFHADDADYILIWIVYQD